MARNKLSDLNNHLFMQLERLGDEDLKDHEVVTECKRAKAISGVARNIIDNAKVCLEATKLKVKEMPINGQLPEQFQLKAQDNG